MRKILFGIFMFFLVSLMAGSVSAAAPSCSVTGTDLSISDYLITLPLGTVAIPNVGLSGVIDLSVDITGLQSSGNLTITSNSFNVYLYDKTGITPITGTGGISTAFAAVTGTTVPGTITPGETETWEGKFTMPSSIVPTTYLTDHNFMLYIRVEDGTNCALTSGDTIVVNQAPVMSTIVNKVIAEDAPLSFTFTASDPDTTSKGDILSYTITTSTGAVAPSGLSVTSTSTGGSITWTPVNSQVGIHTLVLTAKDGYGGERSVSFSITVTNTNDAPVVPSISTVKVQQDLAISSIVLPVASDVDVGDVATYTLSVVSAPTDSTFSLTYFNVATRTISGWIPAKADTGELKLRLTATDLNSATGTQDFTIEVYPKAMCEAGELGGKIVHPVSIDKPASGDEFGPGDKIPVEVTVENNAADDMDVVVKAVLYDTENNKKIAEVESDDENINEDEDFTFALELPIPMDSDEEYGGDYAVYVKAYEDGAEEENCYSDMVEIDLGRESHDVIIQSMTISPANAAPGSKVDITLNVLNLGKKDEEGVTVKLRNADLSIDLTSDARNLGSYDKAGNSYTFRFSKVQIPSDAELKTHDLETYVLFDSGSKSTTYIDSPTFKLSSSQLVVAGPATETAKSMVSVGSVQESTEGTLTMPVIVTNTEGKTGLTVSISNVDEWAQDVSEKSVSAAKGQSETVYFNLKLNDDVEAGKYTGTITVKSNGNVVDTKAFTLDIDEEMATTGPGVLSALTGSKVLWIVGDIVLIVVAIFFIKLIFTGKKKRKSEIKEVRL